MDWDVARALPAQLKIPGSLRVTLPHFASGTAKAAVPLTIT